MANLNDLFDVLRGWHPGGDSSVDHSFEPLEVAGVPVTLLPGTIVERQAATETVDAAVGTVDVTPGTGLPKKLYVVLEGNGEDLSTQFVDKVVCLSGKLVLKTDKIDSGSTFPVNGPLMVGHTTAGLLEDHDGSAKQYVGIVLQNNVAADGTITVEVDL